MNAPGIVRRARRGFTIVELLVALVILAAAMALVVRVVATAADQRRETARRRTAVQEAANVLERIVARPWEEIDETQLDDVRLSPHAVEALPGAKLKVKVAEDAGRPAARRVAVTLTWNAHGDEAAASTQLVGWKFSPPVEAQP